MVNDMNLLNFQFYLFNIELFNLLNDSINVLMPKSEEDRNKLSTIFLQFSSKMLSSKIFSKLNNVDKLRLLYFISLLNKNGSMMKNNISFNMLNLAFLKELKNFDFNNLRLEATYQSSHYKYLKVLSNILVYDMSQNQILYKYMQDQMILIIIPKLIY
jgi:hypothetical protein